MNADSSREQGNFLVFPLGFQLKMHFSHFRSNNNLFSLSGNYILCLGGLAFADKHSKVTITNTNASGTAHP